MKITGRGHLSTLFCLVCNRLYSNLG